MAKARCPSIDPSRCVPTFQTAEWTQETADGVVGCRLSDMSVSLMSLSAFLLLHGAHDATTLVQMFSPPLRVSRSPQDQGTEPHETAVEPLKILEIVSLMPMGCPQFPGGVSR